MLTLSTYPVGHSSKNKPRSERRDDQSETKQGEATAAAQQQWCREVVDPLHLSPDALLRISRSERELPLSESVIRIAALIDFSNHSFALLCKDYSNSVPKCRVFYFQYYFQSEGGPRPVPEVLHLERCLEMYIYTIHMAQEPKEKMEEALGLGLKVKSRVRREKVKRNAKNSGQNQYPKLKRILMGGAKDASLHLSMMMGCLIIDDWAIITWSWDHDSKQSIRSQGWLERLTDRNKILIKY